MDEITIIKVDSKTFNELYYAHDQLIGFLSWLMQRNDLEAAGKLMLIVSRMSDLMVAILEGQHPEISRIIDALNRFHDEIKGKLARASTQEEKEYLFKEAEEKVGEYQKQINELRAEAERQEKLNRERKRLQ